MQLCNQCFIILAQAAWQSFRKRDPESTLEVDHYDVDRANKRVQITFTATAYTAPFTVPYNVDDTRCCACSVLLDLTTVDADTTPAYTTS